jgi:PD-(D/E)XK nuclease superfamily
MIAPAVAPPTRQPTIKDIIAELLETVSATRLNCWQQCRLKFWYRYVLRLKKPPQSAFHVGTVVHSVLQAWNLARWRHKAVDVETLKQHFQNTWQESLAGQKINWKAEEEEQKTLAWSLLETYFRDTPITLDEKPEAVEVSVEADLSIHGLPKIVGVIDLVRAGGRIVDFKTSGQTPTPDKAAHLNGIQTSCYSVMYRESTGRKESGVELHHLVKLKTPKLVITPLEPMSENQQTRLFRIIESYGAGLDREDFVPSPGLHCSGCEFFNECKWS